MEKRNVREALVNCSSVAGSAAKELKEIQKVQELNEPTDVATFSVGCGNFLTIVCCE